MPRFRAHLEDTERADLPKLKWRADLLNFVLTLHELRDVLKTEFRYVRPENQVAFLPFFLKIESLRMTS